MFGYEPDRYFEMAMKQWNKCLLGGIEETSGMINFKLNFKKVPEAKILTSIPPNKGDSRPWLKLPPSKTLQKSYTFESLKEKAWVSINQLSRKREAHNFDPKRLGKSRRKTFYFPDIFFPHHQTLLQAHTYTHPPSPNKTLMKRKGFFLLREKAITPFILSAN